MTHGMRLLAVAAILAVAPSRAPAIDHPTQDTVRFAFRGASALCHNLSLSTNFAARARTLLNAASKHFSDAEQLAMAAQYVPAFKKAKKALGKTTAAGGADANVLAQLFVNRGYVSEVVRTFVATAIAEAAAAYPSEAAEAQALVDEGYSKQQQGNVTAAVAKYRKAAKLVLGFVTL